MKGFFLIACLQLMHSLSAYSNDIRPVGTFGGFINEQKTEIPQNNGFLAFAADTNLAEHRIQWKRFAEGGKDYSLATMKFPIAKNSGKLHFRDWSTIEVKADHVSAYLSKTFPAIRYQAQTQYFNLATASTSEAPLRFLIVVINGKITCFDLRFQTSIDLRGMSEPWLLFWAGDDKTRQFDVPLYLTLENRPESLNVVQDGVQFNFSNTVGIVNIMPLRGVMRFNRGETANWHKRLPDEILFESRAWVQKLAAFPIALKEEFKIDSTNKKVIITDRYQYQILTDAWGTQATPIAPLPPVIVRAGTKGYPVQYPQGKPKIARFATFYGPYSYFYGTHASYEIPIPRAIENLPIALNVKNSPETTPVRKELEKIISEKMPQNPSSYYVQNDDIAVALMCDAYATFEKNGDLQKKIRELVPRLLEGSFAQDRVPYSTEPVTGQQYRSPGKHQYEKTPFDREWYTGRKLAAITRCAESLDIAIAKKHWDKILGLYRYSQIFYDWVTGSVTSSVFGFNQLADGIHFIWEGILGVARMAKQVGDIKTYQDAVYRSARQQLALYAIWHQAEWSKQIDYGIAHFSVKRLPNHLIETRGAVDAWVEDFGSATLEFESHWQTANFIYFDNGAQYSFYRDFGIIEKVRKIEYEIMPQLQPDWTDGNVMHKIDNKYFGSGHTIAHLLARAVLFHDDPAHLYDIYRGFEGTEVSKQWYTPYFYGNSGPLLLGIERAHAPVVEVPVGSITVKQASYDMKTNSLSLEYTCRDSRNSHLRVRTLGGTIRDLAISCQQNSSFSILVLVP